MSTEDQRIKALIEDVVVSILGRYVIRIVLAVMVLSGTILTTGFYGGVQLSKINDTMDRMAKQSAIHDGRLALLEKSMPSAYTRWTASMMNEYNEQIRKDNPMFKAPDTQAIRRSYLHEVTP